MIRIGLLICGHVREEIVAKHGEYGMFFKRLLGDEDFVFVDYFVVDGEFPKDTRECDAYLLSGSAYGAYEEHPFISPLEDLIRDAYAKDIRLVGICFGHQIMAQALGGKVEKFAGGWGLGVHDYSIDLGQGPSLLKLNAVHQDQVTGKPPEANVIGSSDFCENAALAYGKKAVSFQPHPEFDRTFMEDLIELRRGKSFSEKVGDAATATLEQSTGNDQIGNYIKHFFRQV